jgi:hypothetical protein
VKLNLASFSKANSSATFHASKSLQKKVANWLAKSHDQMIARRKASQIIFPGRAFIFQKG